jgi:paraquat-inducible protein B
MPLSISITERSKFVTDKQAKDTNENPVEAFSEVSQALAETISAAQERNLKYAQSVFESTMALLAENTRTMLKQWEQQAQKQHVDSQIAEGYLNLFRAPLTAYQQTLEVVETASNESIASFKKAAESFEKAMQQGREQWEEATHKMQQTLKETEK